MHNIFGLGSLNLSCAISRVFAACALIYLRHHRAFHNDHTCMVSMDREYQSSGYGGGGGGGGGSGSGGHDGPPRRFFGRSQSFSNTLRLPIQLRQLLCALTMTSADSETGPVTDYTSSMVHWMRHRQPRYKGGGRMEMERPSLSYTVDVCSCRGIQASADSYIL